VTPLELLVALLQGMENRPHAGIVGEQARREVGKLPPGGEPFALSGLLGTLGPRLNAGNMGINLGRPAHSGRTARG
ncbi:MAG: hypothetical protein V3R43_03785, partial [bacterium]